MIDRVKRSGDLFVPRQRDRRRAIGELMGALMRALDRRLDVSLMRGDLENTLCRLLPVRTVQLRDGASRWTRRGADQGAIESVAFDVQSADPAMAGSLEATFEPGCRPGEWDFQMLGVAAHVAALVLEIERLRLQLTRASLLQVPRGRRDVAVPLIGSTPVMQQLRDRIERVAATDFTVLIEGESGVGKELVARQVHELSRRRNGPFVAINCAALVETLLEAELFGIEDRTATGVRGRRGKFEAADGGTLFLDEVSDLSMSAQAKLLRAIQELAVERVGGNGAHRVDIRIVAASNRSLAEMVERKLFRPDLFYRLTGVDVRVPTLRERRPDILELAEHFLARHRNARALQLSGGAARALLDHDWPGNVRELERVIERTVALAEADVIAIDDLSTSVRGDYARSLGPSLQRNDTLRAWASRYVHLVVERANGNKREACRILGISYHTLQAHLKFGATNGARSDDPGEDPAMEDTEYQTAVVMEASDQG